MVFKQMRHLTKLLFPGSALYDCRTRHIVASGKCPAGRRREVDFQAEIAHFKSATHAVVLYLSGLWIQSGNAKGRAALEVALNEL